MKLKDIPAIKKELRETVYVIIAHDMLASSDFDTYEVRVEKATKRIMDNFESTLTAQREEGRLEALDGAFDEAETRADIAKINYSHGYNDCKKGRKKAPHDTRDGYCCACDYDLAVMEEKIRESREEIIKEERERVLRIASERAKDLHHKRIALGFCRVAGCKRKLKSKVFCTKHLKLNNEAATRSHAKHKIR